MEGSRCANYAVLTQGDCASFVLDPGGGGVGGEEGCGGGGVVCCVVWCGCGCDVLSDTVCSAERVAGAAHVPNDYAGVLKAAYKNLCGPKREKFA